MARGGIEPPTRDIQRGSSSTIETFGHPSRSVLQSLRYGAPAAENHREAGRPPEFRY